MMCSSLLCLVVFSTIYATFAIESQYIPKSYYVIDHNGQKSDVVYFRSRRAVETFPILRLRRQLGGSSATSFSSASSSASSSATSSASASSSAGAGIPVSLPGFIDFQQRFGGTGHQQPVAAAAPGVPGFGVGNTGYNGPILFSRVGEDQGSGVHVSGSAQGPQGSFSSSSTSVDKDGKISYSVQSGKY